MFEGSPIPLDTAIVIAPLLWVFLAGIIASAALKWRFNREWNLTVWSAYRMQRVWQRMPDEAARTGGTLISHFLGCLQWGIGGGVWALGNALPDTASQQTVWAGIGWGALLGLCILISRQLAGLIGAWMTLEHEAMQRGLEADRHLRVWLMWVLMAGLICAVIRNPAYTVDACSLLESIWTIWIGWMIVKWLRVMQLVFLMRLHFGWGIAYLCTFEIGPTWILFDRAFGA